MPSCDGIVARRTSGITKNPATELRRSGSGKLPTGSGSRAWSSKIAATVPSASETRFEHAEKHASWLVVVCAGEPKVEGSDRFRAAVALRGFGEGPPSGKIPAGHSNGLYVTPARSKRSGGRPGALEGSTAAVGRSTGTNQSLCQSSQQSSARVSHFGDSWHGSTRNRRGSWRATTHSHRNGPQGFTTPANIRATSRPSRDQPAKPRRQASRATDSLSQFARNCSMHLG